MTAKRIRKTRLAKELIALEVEETPMCLRQMVLQADAEGIISHTQTEKLCTEYLPTVENERLSPREIMRLPFEERQRLLTESIKAAQDEDFEIFEAFGEADFFE